MALTYSAGAGMAVTSFLVSETLGSQSQQTGNNTIVMSDIPSAVAAGYGGQVGDGTNGAGDSYLNRRIVIDIAGTPQERIVIADAAGTGTTRILTVHEDWDTNPVATTDICDVYYEYQDMLDGLGTGITLSTRSGFYELTRIITIGNGTDKAGMASHGGLALELADRGTADSFLVQNNGYFRSGYYVSGLPINGGVFAFIAKSDDEPGLSTAAGSESQFLDSLLWGQVALLSHISNATGDVVYAKTKLLKTTLETVLYGDTIDDLSVVGTSAATEITRVDDNTTCSAMTLINIEKLDSEADTAAETLTLSGVVFVNVPGYVDVRQNKTWNMIDPNWDVTTYTQLTWTGTNTGNELNDRRSVTAVVQESDGTKLENALVNIYENTTLGDLVLELSTDADGFASDSFIYLKHATNSVTTTYGGHSLQCGKWLFEPFVAAQVSSESFLGTIVLSPDNNIVQTTQATAKSAGSTVTWNEDTNPSSLFGFDTGSGTLVVGMIITFSGGAVGTITESKDGDSVSGVLHLKDCNATTIGATDTFSRTGGAAGTFSGTCNAAVSPIQLFSIWIDAQTLSYQTIYDYLAAIQNETTLTADGELIWEWCRNAQSQPLYSTGSSFFTERSNSKGIIIVDGGSGTVDYFTDDAGVTWTAPATVTVEVTVLDADTGLAIEFAHVHIYEDDYTTVVLSAATNASGVCSASYAYTTDQVVEGWARNVDFVADDYRPENISGIITASGLTLTVRLTPTS